MKKTKTFFMMQIKFRLEELAGASLSVNTQVVGNTKSGVGISVGCYIMLA
jgi:hypothetical protein